MNDHPHDDSDKETPAEPVIESSEDEDRTSDGWGSRTKTTPPDRIGPYEVIELLGRGGMGCVYLAEQTAPIRRHVAVKLTNPTANLDQMMRRFDVERQAMALMNHPNIAQVFDAGTTDDGQPYFVMEHVQGNRITEYCDENQVEIRGRLELMLAVCDGVHHAHQKGVIHRDLKPSNILVSSEENPIPKIIDFGIAKAVDEPLIDQTLMTGERILGTPAYMSPERIRVDGDIDTRADIYSLGVMLYELLTGELPLPVRDTGYYEIVSKVLTEDAERPSDKVTGFDNERLTKIASERATDGSALRSRLRGDLDWITMKAMEKDRSRRYESVAALAADIRRHLRREPVEAGPPSARYRVTRFVQRHTAMVVSGVLLVAALMVGVIGTSLQARRANREAERANIEAQRANLEAQRANEEAAAAEHVSSFLVDLFKVSDPSQARGESITAREILDRGAEEIKLDLADQPHIQAQLQQTMGTVYEGLGLIERARVLFQAAYESEQALHEEPHQHLVDILFSLGRLNHWENDLPAAENYYRKCMETHDLLNDGDVVARAEITSYLGGVIDQQGRFDEARDLQLEAIEVFREHDKKDLLAMALTTLGANLLQTGRFQEADSALTEARELMESLGLVDHPRYTRNLTYHGEALRGLRQLDEAEELFTRAIAIQEQIFDPEHPRIVETQASLANLLFDAQRYDEARQVYQWVIETSDRQRGRNNYMSGMARMNLATLYYATDDYENALVSAESALEVLREIFGRDHYATGSVFGLLGGIHVKLGHREEAEDCFRAGIENIEKGLGSSHPRYINSVTNFADALEEWGRSDEAAEYRAKLEPALEEPPPSGP